MQREYVIMCGGVYGTAVAWEPAQQGADVVLLEAETIAADASGGLGTRGVRANGRDLRELPLMRMAYALWPKLADEIAAPTAMSAPATHFSLSADRADPRKAGSAHLRANGSRNSR